MEEEGSTALSLMHQAQIIQKFVMQQILNVLPTV